MKFHKIFFAFGILLCLSSCSKNGYEPFNPTKWQYDRYQDTSILPGDDFYRFVCGKGIVSEGADSWTPFSCWNKQESDYEELAFSDGDDNPVPVLIRLNELKKKASSEEQIAAAFANMRERLNGINDRVENKGFPEKAAEYCRNGCSLFLVNPMILDGHKFGFRATAVYMGMLKEWPEQQLVLAGIKDKYNNLLPKARIFEKYLMDNIKDDGETIDGLDAGISEECRRLKEYVEPFTDTKASGSALVRFAVALGNQNPEFVPSDNITRQYFELVDKMEDVKMKEAADAFLWCAAVSFDMDLILNADTQVNFFMTTLYPNLFDEHIAYLL